MKFLPIVFFGLLASQCDFYEKIRDRGVIDSRQFSVFQMFSGKKCRIADEDGKNEVQVDCQKLKKFIGSSDSCDNGAFRPDKAYFPGESQPMQLCKSLITNDFAAKDALRILVFADAGAGQSRKLGYRQVEVAQAMSTLCATEPGCDFAIVSGDLIYPSGVKSVFDSAFDERFEDVYQSMSPMPFYVVPGNHDHVGNVTAQIEYSYFSNMWRMLDRYYAIPNLPDWLAIVGIDTSALIGEKDAGLTVGKQEQIYEDTACEGKGWRIVFGHHPPFSHGKHGNDVKAAQRTNALWDTCEFDLLVNGHDHIQEHISTDRFQQIIQGAGGAKLADLTIQPATVETGTKAYGEYNYTQRYGKGKHGFAILDITSSTIDVRFYATETWKFRDGAYTKPIQYEDHSYHCQISEPRGECKLVSADSDIWR